MSTKTEPFFKPSRMTSPSDLLAKANLVNTTHSKHWSLQRRVPAEILLTREIEGVKGKIHDYIENLKDKNNIPSRYLVIKRISPSKANKGGYLIVGHGIPLFGGKRSKPRILPDMEKVREFARTLGRTRIKCGEKRS